MLKFKLTPQERKYFQMWRNVCIAKGWKQGDDSKRHAVHILALGEDKSHKAFTNHDWDRVYRRLKTLADNEDLDAQIEQLAYELKDKAQKTHKPNVQPGQKTRKANLQRPRASKYERISTEDDPGERRRLLYVIERLFEESFTVSISRNLFDKAEWRSLDIPSLTHLRDTLKTRLETFIGKVIAGEIDYDFGFAIRNARTGRSLSVKAIIAMLVDNNRPVNMQTQAPRRQVFICGPEIYVGEWRGDRAVLANGEPELEEDPF